jgi:cytochrome c5
LIVKKMISLMAVLGLLYGCGSDSGESPAPEATEAGAAQEAAKAGAAQEAADAVQEAAKEAAASAQEAAEEAAEAVQEAAESVSKSVATMQQTAGGSHPGEDTYNRSCFSCHAAGVANAPKTGDAEAWAPRLAKGTEVLVQSVKDGMPPGMPPMGLCMSCSDEQIAAAIDYMVAR